jgi:hypothetical protein
LELSADVRTLSVKVESVSSTTSPFTATKQAADMTRSAKIDIPLMFAISCSFSDVFGKQIAMAEYYCATEIDKPTRVLATSSLELLSRSTALPQWYLSGFFFFFFLGG